jgi:hypothetical protein
VALQVAESVEGKASTPPAEERVTSFFTRVKKEVTKKESTLCGTPGGSAPQARKARADGIYVFVEAALLDDGARSGADQMDWKASRQPRLPKQLLGGAEHVLSFVTRLPVRRAEALLEDQNQERTGFPPARE